MIDFLLKICKLCYNLSDIVSLFSRPSPPSLSLSLYILYTYIPEISDIINVTNDVLYC